jgi:alkylation response protein AidB-like acyl-CoA dehydrogenase
MGLDLTYDDEQLLLQRSAREFFQHRCPTSTVRAVEDGGGFLSDLWRDMAALGWLGIGLPAEHGGSGGTILDLYPLYEEMGRALVPVPHLDTVVLAGSIIAQAGTSEQKSAILPRIAAGELVVSLAMLEQAGIYTPDGITSTARRKGDAYMLDGVKLLVPYADAADTLLCVVRTNDGDGAFGISLALVDTDAPGVTKVRQPNLAGVPLFEVVFDEVSVAEDDVVGRVHEGWEPLANAILCAAVLETVAIVGSGRAVLEMTNQYAKDRHQFGEAIGRYQAVQYLVSDILLDIHRTELLAAQAAILIASSRPYAREAAIAAAFGKRASAHLHRQAHEVHAGVGMMVEHDLNLFTRRAKFWENHLGDAGHFEQVLAEVVGL